MFNDDWDYNAREMERELALLDKIIDKKEEILETECNYRDPENRRHALMVCVGMDGYEELGLSEAVQMLKEALANRKLSEAKRLINIISEVYWDKEAEKLAIQIVTERDENGRMRRKDRERILPVKGYRIWIMKKS